MNGELCERSSAKQESKGFLSSAQERCGKTGKRVVISSRLPLLKRPRVDVSRLRGGLDWNKQVDEGNFVLVNGEDGGNVPAVAALLRRGGEPVEAFDGVS